MTTEESSEDRLRRELLKMEELRLIMEARIREMAESRRQRQILKEAREREQFKTLPDLHQRRGTPHNKNVQQDKQPTRPSHQTQVRINDDTNKYKVKLKDD